MARLDDGESSQLDADAQPGSSDPLTFTERQLEIVETAAADQWRYRGWRWLSLVGIDRDELKGMARLALVQAARAWDASRWPTGQEGYSNYLVTQVHWRMNHQIQARCGVTRRPQDRAIVSLSAPTSGDGDRGLADSIPCSRSEACLVDGADWIDAVLARLSEGERECVRLVWIEGQTLDAAGRAIGITQQAVSGRLNKARERLLASPVMRRMWRETTYQEGAR